MHSPLDRLMLEPQPAHWNTVSRSSRLRCELEILPKWDERLCPFKPPARFNVHINVHMR
jgi:hypothetical protein